MIKLRTEEEMKTMARGGKILGNVLWELLEFAKDGVTLEEIDALAEDLIVESGAEPSFKKVEGYLWTICTSVNDVVVHGTPTGYRLKTGDILGIDCGVYYSGFHTDAAWTIIISNKNTYPSARLLLPKDKLSPHERFLSAGRLAWEKALFQVKKDNYIYDISKAIQETIEGEGYRTVKSLVGHGVGKELHEAPEIPGFIKGKRENTPRIVPGMVLAVEVIYNLGSPDVVYKGNDGWTIATKDGTISGLFESTVAVTSHGSYVLTPIQSGQVKL